MPLEVEPTGALTLACVQRAASILFPPVTIALGWVLLRKPADGRNRALRRMAACRPWVKVLAFTIMTAPFLEAAVVGVVLFGFRRGSGVVRTPATVPVAVGTSLSVVWILALNSGTQTRQCRELRGGVADAANRAAIILGPSMPRRPARVPLASGPTAAFLRPGISACRRRRGDDRADVAVASRAGVDPGSALSHAEGCRPPPALPGRARLATERYKP